MNWDDKFAGLIESEELDRLAEQEMREEVCKEVGHDPGVIVACKRCGDAFVVPGQSEEPY